METLKAQLDKKGIDSSSFKNIARQPALILETATAVNGAILMQVQLFKSEFNYPSEIIGKTVLVIEYDELVDIEEKKYNTFF